MRNLSFPLAVCALAAAVLTSGCSGDPAEQPRSWRLSHITSDTSAWHQGALRFAQGVKGELPDFEVQVYPFGQLANGDQKTELQMARSGVIDAVLVSPIVLALYVDPRFDVLSLPFLFEDHATARRAIATEPFSEILTGLLSNKMMVPLGWGANGFRQLTNSERAVRTPADLDGLKVRVAGTRLFLDIFSLLGADGLTMSFGELYPSLEQGVVEGQENPLSIIESSRLYEVQDHLTLWNYVYDPIVMVVSVPVWDKLSQREKSIVIEQARVAMEWQADLVEREDEELVETLVGHGVEVAALSSDEIAAFRKAVEPIHQRYRPRIGATVVDALYTTLERIRASSPAEPSATPGAASAPAPEAAVPLADDEAPTGEAEAANEAESDVRVVYE